MLNFQYGISLVLFVTLNSCGLDGFFVKETEETKSETTEVLISGTEVEGIVTGMVHAESLQSQKIGASQSSAIQGSSVIFPPGSLQISTNISIEEGASLTGLSSAQELGLSGSLQAAGIAVVLTSSEKIDAIKPMSLSIGISSTSLSLEDDQNIVVIYKIYDAGKDAYFLGIIPERELKISENIVTFETRFFGAYQVAFSEEKIAKKVETKSETPFLSAAAEKSLPEIDWLLGNPRFEEPSRKAKVPFKVAGFESIVHCSVAVFESKTASPVYRSTKIDFKPLNSGKTSVFEYNIKKAEDHRLYVKFECEDKSGRKSQSKFSKALSIPKAIVKSTIAVDQNENENGEQTFDLAFTGAALLSADPRGRVVIENAATTLTGFCDSNHQVKISGWGVHTEQIIDCSAGSFSIVMGYDENLAGIAAHLTDGLGGKEVVASQTGKISARTILFKALEADDIIYLGQSSDSDTTELTHSIDGSSSKFYVLEENVIVNGSWVPLGSSSTPFAAIFDGNGKTISDISITAATDDVGFFGHVHSDAQIRNLKLENVVISVAGDFDNIGAFAGYLGGGPVEFCSVEGSIIHSSGTSENVGGFAGNSLTPYILRSKASVDITGENFATNVGGFIGKADAGIIEDAYSTGTITGTSNVGGFAGILVANSGAMIAKAYATGSVSCSETHCGGFVGVTSNEEGIFASYTVSTLTPGSGYTGGFAGSYASYGLFDTFFSNAQGYCLGNNTDVTETSHCEKVNDPSSFYGSSHSVYESINGVWLFGDRWITTSTYPKLSWE